jgi:hypothetical protein
MIEEFWWMSRQTLQLQVQVQSVPESAAIEGLERLQEEKSAS